MQCERCKEIVPFDDFALDGDALRVRCSACRGEFRVALPRPAASEPAAPAAVRPATPGEGCPKCAATVTPGAPACPRCGLVRDRFTGFATEPGEAPAEVVELWTRVEAEWSDTARHHALVDAAARHAAWAWALGAYRRAGRDDPAAAEARERLVKLAEGALLVAPKVAGGPTREPYKRVVVLLVVILLIGGVLGVVAMLKASAAARREPTAPRAPGLRLGGPQRTAPTVAPGPR